MKLAASEIKPEGMMLKRKLGPQWYGPFKVLKLVGKSCYQIELPRNVKAHDIFHVSVLERFHTDDKHQERQAATPQVFPAPEEHRNTLQEFENDGAEYIVLNILDIRIHRGHKQWLALYESGATKWQTRESFESLDGDEITEAFYDYTKKYPDQLSQSVDYWKKLLKKRTFISHIRNVT